jgi:acyl-CoA synthetase (AMP-forming)/AMP-acid ligase II
VIGLFAITRIGAVAVLLNTYNKVPELNRTLRHSDQFALLTVGTHLSNDYLDRIEQAAPGIVGQKNEHLMIGSHPFLRSVWTWGAEPRSWCGSMSDLVQRGAHISDEFLAEVESEVHPADPMVFVYSSGSTSDPKAAVHSHGATVRHAHNLWQMRDLQDDDVLYTPMPLFWVGGFSYTLIACMYAGAAVVFEEQFEPGATLELIERERVTQVLGWPHIGKALVDHPDFKTRDDANWQRSTLALYKEDGSRSEVNYVRALDYTLLGKAIHATDEVDVTLVTPRARKYETAGAASSAATGKGETKEGGKDAGASA